MGKNGTETNFLQCFRSWKDYKITKFDAEYRDAMREFKKKEYNMEDELKELQYEPEILRLLDREFFSGKELKKRIPMILNLHCHLHVDQAVDDSAMLQRLE